MSKDSSENETDMAEEAERLASEEDSWEPVEVEVKPRGTDVISFRLPSEENDELIRAAKMAGESLSQFIRGAIAIRLHGTPIGPAVDISPLAGGSSIVVRSHIVVSSRTEKPESDWIPEHPPEGVTITSG